jgi:hypothetical protein
MTWLLPRASAISTDHFNERFITCSPEQTWHFHMAAKTGGFSKRMPL